MRTNLLNDLSNVVKKGAGLACSWSQVGRMSGEGAIEHPLSTHSAPFWTRWKPAGEKGSTRVWKHVAMIFAVLVMSIANIGMAWGADFTATDIKNGSSSGNITVSTAGLSNDQSKNVCSGTKANSVSANTSAGATYSGKYIEIQASSGYTISTLSLLVRANGESSCVGAVVFWNGTASATCNSYNTFTAPANNSADCSGTVSITVPSGTRTVRIYRAPQINSSTKTFSSGDAIGGTSTFNIFSVSATAAAAVAKDYTVSTAVSGGVGGTVSSAASSLNKDETTTITATPAAGYQVTNWAVSGTGASISPSGASNSNTTTLTMGTANATVTVTFGLKSYTVTLNNQSATSAGTENVTTTYNSNTNLTSAITKPTKTGYVFAGYFTGTNGTGIQLIDPAGNWIASAGGDNTYMDGSKNWKYDNNLTLYACWMEYVNTFDIQTWVQNNIDDTKTSKTFTVLGTNHLLYSLAGNTVLDNSEDVRYEGLKFKNSGDYVLFLVEANSQLQVTFGYVKTTLPKYSINGGAETSFSFTKQSDNQAVDFGTQTYDRLVKIKAMDGDACVLKKITITAPVVATCTDKYSFHYGPATGAWETPICFEQVGSTHEWNITNFTIPDHTNGQFWVGHHGETNGQSATKAWTDSYSESNGVGNGAMLLLPTNGSVVGNAVGATGTLVIWDNSSSKNQYVGFKPDGYSIRYSGTDHVFTETATANKWETDVVTLPDVSTNYTMEIATEDGYTTCYHSNAPEAISNMGVTNVAGGKKAIYLVPGSFNAAGAKYAVYDVTNTTFDTDFMSDTDGDGIYVGYVGSNCSSMILCRMNSDATTSDLSSNNWEKRWNQTANIGISGDLAKKYTITNMTTWNECAYTTANMQPITGQKGKFRMWANSNDNNWYVHFIPYYVLSYDANGGSGTTAATERNSESSMLTVSVTSNGFTAPTGYQFAGWATSDERADARTVDYAAGASYTLTSNATLYAVWTPILVTGITVSPSSKTLDVGGTQQLSVEVLPATALDKAVTWSTSNGSIATVSSTGLVTAKAPGSATITATAHDGSGVTGTCSITVNKIQPTKYDFSVNKTVLCGEETATLTLDDSEEGATYELRSDATHSIADTEQEGTGDALVWEDLGVGSYVVYAIDNGTYSERQMNSSKITIAAATATSISSQPAGIADATVGEEQTLSVTAAGTNLSYQWQESATEDGTYTDVDSDGTSASYSVTPAAAGTKWYKCVVTGDCGEVTSNKVSIVAAEGDDDDCIYSEVAKVTLTGDGDSAPTCTGSYSPSGAVKGLQDGNATGYYKLGGKPSYVKLQLGGGNTFQVGDSIILEIRAGDLDPATGTGSQSSTPVRLFTNEGATAFYTSSALTANTLHTVRIKVTADMISAGLSNTIYIYRTKDDASPRYSQNHQVKSIAVKHCTPSCSTPDAPTSPTNGATTSNSQAVSWTDTSNSAWEVYVNTSSSTPDAGQSPTAEPTSTSYTFTGLTASTEYHWWVRSVCDASHKSAWVAGSSFTTSAAPTLYTVTFNSNGGSTTPDAIEQASEGASITMPAAPTKSGYTFQGWVIGGTTYAAGASYTPTANVTAYATWKENCTGGGGGGTTLFSATHTSSSTMSASTGSVTLSSTSSEQVNNGIKFSGDDGYIEATGTSSFATGDVITVRVYNASGSTADRGFKLHNKSGTAHTASIGATSTADIEYTLAAADIESNGKLRILRSNSNVRIQSVTVVRPAGTCFYVTYNGNGAEAGSISDATAYAASEEVTVSSNTGASAFTKSGYHVGSWNTAANGSGTTYALGATFNISADMTLYAQWVADACSAPSEPTISGTSVRTVGQTISLIAFCESGKDARTTYTWYKGATWDAASATTPVQAAMTIEEGGRMFDKASCVAGDAGTYWCEASNGAGCASHNATGFAVTVNDAAGGEHIYFYKDDNHYSDGVYSDPEGNTATLKDNQNLSSPWMICNGCMTGVDSVVAHGATYDGKGNHMNAYIKLPTGGDATTKNIKFALTAGYTGTLTMKIGGYENNPTVTLQPLTAGVLGSAITPTSGTVGGVATTEDNFNAIEWPLATAGGTYVLTVTSKTGYISQIDMTTSTSATFNVTYNGNGNTGGTVPTDATNYASGATVTAAANSGSLVKTNYTGAGWNTANNGTGTNYVPGSGTFKITANTTLYAHWTQLITLAPGTQGTGSNNAAVSWNGSVLRGFAAHTASGYALHGYYTEPSGGTKVLNADGSFAATNIDGFVTSGKWSNTGAAPTLYAQWEASNLLKWNLKVNVSETSITTLSKESAAPTVIAVANMGNLTNNGSLTITGSAKSGLTSKIATTASAADDDAGKYMSVQFLVAAGYQLVPSDIKVKVQPISHSQTTKLILEDNNSQSISYTSGSLSKGSTHTVTMTNSVEVAFTGTVTLKIYVYGTAESDGYRLGTPIEINGSVEATCTPPTFSGISYSATEYTVGASASAISVTGAANVDSYQWKYNTVNDRTLGTDCGTGASVTPSTESTGTLYYWCELTNTCTTVKTAAVGITVRNATTDPTVTWSNVKLGATDDVTPNYGGGNYVLRATVDQSAWPGTLAASMITAPAGITIHHVTTGTDDSGKKYIEFKFDVTTAFDRASNATIDFNLALPEAGSYSALNSVKSVTYNDCSGGAAGQVAIKMGATASTSKSNPQNYWETAGAGRLMFNYGSNMGSTNNPSGYKTADSTFYYYAASTGQKWMFQTYIAGVNKVRVVFRAAGTIKSSKATITNFYYNTEYFASPGSNAVSFGDVNANKAGYSSGEDGYIEFTVPEMAANSYGAFVTADGNMKVYGVVLYTENAGGGGSVATNPAWSDSKTDGFTVNKSQGDANFTYTISTTTNTLGAITYSSSNPSVAAVDPVTGEVTITATGESAQSTVITATLARSGCYQGATRTYTINVTGLSCSDVAGTISTEDLGCDGIKMTLSGYTEGASIQWYKDGETIDDDGDEPNVYTATSAGRYYAVTHKDCNRTSNTVEIADKSVSATREISKWYIKNGRPTPDIKLWTLGKGTHLTSVAWSSDNGTGLTGAEDIYERDGAVWLSGREPNTNSGEDVSYTLTLTVNNGCSEYTTFSDASQQITIVHQKNTDKHVLAFVVNGTAKGDFTEGITAAQTTSVGLYNAIAAQFDVQATNIYATDDEKKLKEYYSQYDILCITDYPNTQTKGANSKSYVDAIGALIDIRPILTMEAFVSALPNWKLKGVSGNPKSPSTRQYTMLLQCKDHEIFSGTTLTKVGEGEDAMYRVTMVDKNQEEYKTLDANYGDGEHKANEGYQYGKKPALQGFTYTEEMSDNDMLPLGLIDDGAGNDLQVGIERQKEMSARMMVLGINSYAMERLDGDGEAIVINALKYLMKKSAEDISDCSVYFDGSDETDPKNWDNELNWGPSYASLPLPHQEVRILKECVVKDGVVARASGIKIIPRGRINHDTDDASGSLTIEPGGALIVDGKVRAAVAPNYFTAIQTTPADLYIAADETKGNGTLIFDNEDGETQATVGYYSKATTDENTTWNWQYMAVPFNDNSSAHRNFYDSYLYRWAENCSGWEVVPNQGAVYPWVGYTITQVGQKMYYMDGTLVETGEQTFTVPAGKNLVVGNSWTAPIQVKQFEDADFAGMSKNVYLFNTGYDPNGEGEFDKDDGRYEAGTYVTVPIHASPYTGDSLISSLQAFTVYATGGGGGGTFTLNYDRHIRPARTTDNLSAGPMHAPKRGGAIDDKPAVLKVWASGSRYDDRLIVLEREDFSTGLDEGWDGNKRVAGNSSPLIFAVTDNGREAVSAIPTMEGTLIGFWAGEDNEYRLHFEYDEEDELYLLDLDNNTYTPVNSNSTYVFTVPDKKAHNRFILTRNAPNPVATGVEETQASEKPEAKAIKFLKDEKVFIFVNGKLYDATGKIVK